MSNIFAALAGVCLFALAVCQVALLVAAWRSGFDMGILTTFIPFYAVTTGNWRLKTERRREIRNAWIACAVLWILFATMSGCA